jgi:hypothetical protein
MKKLEKLLLGQLMKCIPPMLQRIALFSHHIDQCLLDAIVQN